MRLSEVAVKPDSPPSAEVIGHWVRRFEILAAKRVIPSLLRLVQEIAEWTPVDLSGRDESVMTLADAGILDVRTCNILDSHFLDVGEALVAFTDPGIGERLCLTPRAVEKIRVAFARLEREWVGKESE